MTFDEWWESFSCEDPKTDADYEKAGLVSMLDRKTIAREAWHAAVKEQKKSEDEH